MTEQSSAEVLICGAGAAGLTLAVELARRSVSFRLIEKLDDPFRGSRGKGIQPRTQEIFEDLGVLDRMFAVGGLYPPQRVYAGDGTHADTEMEMQAATPAEPYQRPLMVPQFLTEAVLRERLLELGHRPDFGCELTGFEQDDDGVTAQLSGRNGTGESVRVHWLVGADGGRSFVRHALDIGFPGKTLGVRAMVADVTLTGLRRDVWHRFGEGDMARQISICPLAGTQMFQLQAPVPLEGDVDLSVNGLNALVAERTERSDIRIDTALWTSAFNMNARLADRYRDGRVFLVGDAAHTHPPTGGQGLNTSVQDAYNLGWKLAAVAGGAPRALLDSYEEERRPVAATMLGLAVRLLDAARDGNIKRGREVKQLDIGYPWSSLAPRVSHRDRGVMAGDRAPDAPLCGAAGQTRRLFELLNGTHWTLIGYEVGQAAVAPRAGLRMHHVGPDAELTDAAGHFRTAYGMVAGDWVLVRPDGYVGAIAAAADLDALEAFLLSVGLGSADHE